MNEEELVKIERDFSQALRQWKMYWDMTEEASIDTSKVVEAAFYRECEDTLNHLRNRSR